ncbi:MAG: hypothetical protein BGO67_07395 [Alphaproteobacteria bacterium 41-28]|nr:MAG: hypothetical protein BGO67_07395 [Alphaproteobacteria bacterium 41-28]
MAIQFARCEYISRRTGANACRKASYNQRDTVPCERTGEVFSFKDRGGNVHHEILLPEGADSRFKNSRILWNEVERCEKRINSQLAKEFVLALPDDPEITLGDRIELARRFTNTLVEKGIAAQLDVHSPHDGEKNWHAHLLVTTRRFSEDGLTFGAKARDLDPVIRSGHVVEANLWGEIWKEVQNTYFEEKGYHLRVDPIGIIPQEHLGPVRMRHHMNEAILRSQVLQKANERLAQDPRMVLETLTQTQAVFSKKDVEIFLKKHVPLNEREGLLEEILSDKSVLSLFDKETETGYFTTQDVRSEEEKLIRFADTIAKRRTFALPSVFISKGLSGKIPAFAGTNLSAEQRKAYELCVSSGQNLSIIQGRAGVGKSYVLDAIRIAHQFSNYRVLGLAPTHKVATALKENGFQEAKTCHSFLFAFKNGREKLDSNTLVIVDEAGMLGTELSVELFNVIKNNGAKLILVGDDRQLSSVARGRTFSFLAERYGSVELKEIRRQTVAWQKAVSEDLFQRNIKSAVRLLQENKAILWDNKKEESLNALLKAWSRDSLLNPQETRQILAHRNVDVDALNAGARDFLRQQGRLGDLEVTCKTQRGMMTFATGDRVQFMKTDKEQGLTNGYFGIIEHINPETKRMTICLDNQEKKDVDPHTYEGLRHGYAATIYKSQGSTLNHIYVLHSKLMNRHLHYVALTRQTKSLSLYVSQDETPHLSHLIHQMEKDENKGTSLVFDTKRDIQKRRAEKSFSNHFKNTAEKFYAQIKDLFHKNKDFYNFERPANKSQESVTFSLFKPLPESKGTEQNTFTKKEQRESLSAKAISFIDKKATHPLDARQVEHALKQNMTSFADHIFESMGEPYHRASSSAIERRYGKKGHISVNLRTGAWIDYKNSEMSGGPLHLLTKLKDFSFKEAVEYGASWAGLTPEKSDLFQPQLVSFKNEKNEVLERETKEKKQKIAKAQALWQKGKDIQGTIAERYLREHRKIEGELPQDLRYLPADKMRLHPSLMVAARSQTGEVTAVQLTLLNPQTAAKAKIDVAKRSYGLIKGSAVTIQACSHPREDGKHREPAQSSHILFIAEGVETALSIKETGVREMIKASLGLSNIGRLTPNILNESSLNGPSLNGGPLNESPHTRIIIYADHDAPDSSAAKSLHKSVQALQDNGYEVTVIKPDHLGEDFNDVLKQKGPQGVREILERSLPQELKNGLFKEQPSLQTFSEKGPTEALSRRKESENLSQPIKAYEKHAPIEGQLIFESVIKHCEKHLYDYLEKEKRHLTPELQEQISIQSKRAANYIFHSHTLKETTPTLEETKLFLLRAKYELNRIPEIRMEIMKDWQREGHFDETKANPQAQGSRNGLMAHMIAQRQASIEGRLYLEAKQKGLNPSYHIPDWAEQEFKNNRQQTKSLAQKIVAKHSLPEKAALYCAKDILRYKETHGEKPTTDQIAKMVQVSKELEGKTYAPRLREYGSHEIEFLRRNTGDLLFRHLSSHNVGPIPHDIHYIQTQAKTSLEATTYHILQDLLKLNQKELSL